MAQPSADQGSKSPVVLDILIDISTCLQVTEEYITKHKEAEGDQSSGRLVHPMANNLQPSW